MAQLHTALFIGASFPGASTSSHTKLKGLSSSGLQLNPHCPRLLPRLIQSKSRFHTCQDAGYEGSPHGAVVHRALHGHDLRQGSPHFGGGGLEFGGDQGKPQGLVGRDADLLQVQGLGAPALHCCGW